jgi:transposase-like protein
MRIDQFKSLVGGLTGLTTKQLDELRKAVEAQYQRTQGLRALDATGEGLGCPHCSSFKFTKNGHSRGLQRYLCSACSRTFNAATNTPLSRLRGKERFFQHGECLAQGLSIGATAAEMGIAVSTAFRMRHRFLQEVVSHQPRQVAGLLEADETYVRESQKGSRHMTDRRGTGAAPRQGPRGHGETSSYLSWSAGCGAATCRRPGADGHDNPAGHRGAPRVGQARHVAVHGRERCPAGRRQGAGGHVEVDCRELRREGRRGRVPRPDRQQLPRTASVLADSGAAGRGH